MSMLLIIVLSSNGANASCGIKRVVRHINGIWTNDAAARRNIEALKSVYGSTFAGQDITLSYSYNDGNGLWDLYFQKDIEADPEKSRSLALALLSGNLSSIDTAHTGEQSSLYSPTA